MTLSPIRRFSGQLSDFLFGSCMLGDIIAMPAELKIFRFGRDEEVEQFHYEWFGGCGGGAIHAHQFLCNCQDRGGKVASCEAVPAWHFWVEEVLDTPDSAF
jgi:hypothetical protein